MLSPREERAARARADAAAVADAAVGLRHLAAGIMGASRTRGQLDVTMAGLVEALSRSFHEMPHEVVTCALAVVRAVHDSRPRPRPDRSRGHGATARDSRVVPMREAHGTDSQTCSSLPAHRGGPNIRDGATSADAVGERPAFRRPSSKEPGHPERPEQDGDRRFESGMLPDMAHDANSKPERSRSRWAAAAQLGQAHWFFGNLYEALVGVPQLLADARPQRNPRLLGPRSPIRYYVPAAPLTLAATAATLIDSWRSGGDKRAIIAAAASTATATALGAHLISTVNLPLLHGDEPLSPARRRHLVRTFHSMNLVRLVALAVGARALLQATTVR